MIVTAEEIVDNLTSDVQIPGALVTAVAHAPGGAWPTSCFPLYPVAGGEILDYIEACDSGAFRAYVQQFTGQSRAGEISSNT